MQLDNQKNKIIEYVLFILSFIVFYFIYSHTLNYGRTFDDDLIIDKYINSPGDAKLLSSYFYARFHFYPIYFLSHELDNFFTVLLNNIGIQVLNSQVAKFTNIFIHVSNSFLIIILLKNIFDKKNDFKSNLIFYFSSLFFLFHPTTSQVIFNITTRNESLALFFALLAFIYCFNTLDNKKLINFVIIGILFFFSLCSKLMTVFFVGLIPLTIFLKRLNEINLKDNLKSCYDIFLSLIIPFVIFYYLRSEFVQDIRLVYFNDIDNIIFYFFTTLKFYLRGLFFPFEHIYVFAGNYHLNFSIILFFIFFLISLVSIYLTIKKNDPYLSIAVIWIITSLSIPVLFGLIREGFPLISNLAERYQYSSIVSIPILIAWILIKINKKIISNTIILTSSIVLLIFSLIIQFDRSKVYINNSYFFSQAYFESPRNVHRYSFTVPKDEALKNQNLSKYLFYLHQLYSGDPRDEKWIFEYIQYFDFTKNDAGRKYFENEFDKYFYDKPKQKYDYASFLFNIKDYEAAKTQIKEVMMLYEKRRKKYDEEGKSILFMNPGFDDLYYTLGILEFNLGNDKEALKNFKEANMVNPKHGTALYNAAIVLKKMGLIKEAKNLFEEALKINPFLRETVKNTLNNAENN